MKKAVFLDRDGTLIEDRGYITSPENVIFYDNTFEALLKLQKSYELFIITNQSGVAKGLIRLSDVETINAHVINILHKQGIRITNIFVCPHKREDSCECIKPNPYFLQKAAAMYHIDLRNSFSIGDHPCDFHLAENAGGKGIYVLTGHGEKHKNELPENALIAEDINVAVDIILSKDNPELQSHAFLK